MKIGLPNQPNLQLFIEHAQVSRDRLPLATIEKAAQELAALIADAEIGALIRKHGAIVRVPHREECWSSWKEGYSCNCNAHDNLAEIRTAMGVAVMSSHIAGQPT